MSEERRRQAGLIIHAAAVASAGAAAMLSKKSVLGALLKADTPVMTAIAVGMVMALGKLFGQDIGSTASIALLSKYLGSGIEVTGAKSLVGWIPVIGNAANATLTFGFVEALGWKIYDYLDKKHGGKAPAPSKGQKVWNVPIRESIPVTKKIPVT